MLHPSSLKLNKDNTRHARVDRSKPMWPQPYTKNCSQLRNAKSGPGSPPPPGRTHELVVQYRVVSPENTHPGNNTQTERVIVRRICTYTCIYACSNNNEENGHELESEEGEVYGRARRERKNDVIIISTVKEKKKKHCSSLGPMR